MDKMMLKKQYMMYAPKKKGRLPSDFQEVEYIESTGTQYIDSGYNINDNKVKIQIKFRITDWNESGFYLGCGYVGGENAFTASTSYLAIGSNTISAFPNQDSMVGVINELEMEANEITKKYSFSIINGIRGTGSYSGTIKSNLSMPIFKGTLYSGCCDCRVYSFRLYANDVLQRDFIPCYRKSDNEIGMYDLVNGVFYTNQGSGEFLSGVDIVNIDGYKQLDYIAGNNAYIEYPYVTNGYNIGFDISFDVPKTSLTQDTPIIQNDWLSNWVPLGMSLTDKNKTYFGSYDMSNILYWTNDTYTYNEDRYLINYKNSNVISSIGKSTWSHTLNKSLNDVAITKFTFMSVGVPSTFHLKSLDMTDGDNIVAKFIPMEETSTGLVGLYDLIGKKFYSSQTNSNFIKGDYI